MHGVSFQRYLWRNETRDCFSPNRGLFEFGITVKYCMHGASLLCCWSISGEMRREIVLTKTVVSLNFVIRWNTVCTVQAFRGISGEMRLEIVLTKTVVSLNLIIRWNTVCAVWRHYFMRQTAPNPNPLRQTSSSFWLLRCLYAASCLVSAPAAVRRISFFLTGAPPKGLILRKYVWCLSICVLC